MWYFFTLSDFINSGLQVRHICLYLGFVLSWIVTTKNKYNPFNSVVGMLQSDCSMQLICLIQRTVVSYMLVTCYGYYIIIGITIT